MVTNDQRSCDLRQDKEGFDRLDALIAGLRTDAKEDIVLLIETFREAAPPDYEAAWRIGDERVLWTRTPRQRYWVLLVLLQTPDEDPLQFGSMRILEIDLRARRRKPPYGRDQVVAQTGMALEAEGRPTPSGMMQVSDELIGKHDL